MSGIQPVTESLRKLTLLTISIAMAACSTYKSSLDIVTEEGCHVMYSGLLNITPNQPSHWSGGCINNMLTGQGTLRATSINQQPITYVGGMKGGYLDGRGTLTSAQGVISGIFSFGMGTRVHVENSHGKGVGSLDFNGNDFDGKFRFNSGESYQGKMTNWIPNGQGVMTLANGTVQNGNFVSGSFSDNSSTQSIAKQTPGVSTESITPSNISSGAAASYDDAQTVDLSGGCTAAQQKGEQYANRVKADVESAGPAICQNARNTKKLGIVMVRVAESCQEIPSWQELRTEGERMIREGEQTMNGSCN